MNHFHLIKNTLDKIFVFDVSNDSLAFVFRDYSDDASAIVQNELLTRSESARTLATDAQLRILEACEQMQRAARQAYASRMLQL